MLDKEREAAIMRYAELNNQLEEIYKVMLDDSSTVDKKLNCSRMALSTSRELRELGRQLGLVSHEEDDSKETGPRMPDDDHEDLEMRYVNLKNEVSRIMDAMQNASGKEFEMFARLREQKVKQLQDLAIELGID